MDMRWKKLFKDKKDEFKFVFYCPKQNEIFLVKNSYVLLPKKSKWFCYADKEFFGLDKRITENLTWQYLGVI